MVLVSEPTPLLFLTMPEIVFVSSQSVANFAPVK
jgi:hypothetical protein